MKKYISTLIVLSILLGLGTFIFTTNFLYGKIITEPSTKNTLIVLKKPMANDTLSITTIAKSPPSVNIGKVNKSLYLNVFPATFNWIVFHRTALSMGMALMIFLIILIASLIKRFELKLLSIETGRVIIPLILIAGLILVLIFELRIEQGSILYGTEIIDYFNIIFDEPQDTIGTIEKIYFVIGVVPILGLITIILATNRLVCLEPNSQRNINKDYKVLKDNLNIFAFFSGLLVASSVVGFSLLRKMIAEQVPGVESILPNEFIYGYGISFTLFLALFFLPSLVFLKYVKSKYIVVPEGNDISVRWWKIGEESIDDIKLIFSLVLPLLTSIGQSLLSNAI